MTELPYSIDVFAATFAHFNATWWPAVAAGLGACAWIVRYLARSNTAPGRARTALFCLAGCAAVVGGPYQLGAMSPLDFMAPIYGGYWLMFSAALLAVAMRYPTYTTDINLQKRAAAIITAIGLVAYPVLFWLETGADPTGLPLAGSAPGPTAIVIFGTLLGLSGRVPLYLLTAMAIWAVITTMNGYLLGLFTPYLVAATLVVAVAMRIVSHGSKSQDEGKRS